MPDRSQPTGPRRGSSKPVSPRPRYRSGAWAVVRSHVTTSAMAAGAFAFLVGAAPAGSTDGEPMPNVVVSPDCPPNGFLVDGRPLRGRPGLERSGHAGACSLEPAVHHAHAASARRATSPRPPLPRRLRPRTPRPRPPSSRRRRATRRRRSSRKPKPADKPARTRLGDKRVERAKPEADKRRKETRRAATPSPKTGRDHRVGRPARADLHAARRPRPRFPTCCSTASRSRRSCSRSTRRRPWSTTCRGRCWRRSTRSRRTTGATSTSPARARWAGCSSCLRRGRPTEWTPTTTGARTPTTRWTRSSPPRAT